MISMSILWACFPNCKQTKRIDLTFQTWTAHHERGGLTLVRANWFEPWPRKCRKWTKHGVYFGLWAEFVWSCELLKWVVNIKQNEPSLSGICNRAPCDFCAHLAKFSELFPLPYSWLINENVSLFCPINYTQSKIVNKKNPLSSKLTNTCENTLNLVHG